ncbi:hypothetical protein ABC766_08575 [Methylobacterium fujisawaense]|uniref:hypothetical protein n=1 Tax=Methylobacterium fujisawaense TaxID=107400 RepID=UPI0031F54B20
MTSHTKQNRAAPARGPRIAAPGSGRPGRSGSARRARAGAASPRARIFRLPMPVAHPSRSANPYEEFYALSAEGVGLLDPGFDDWDADPRVLVGLSPRLGIGRDDA